MGQAPPRMIPDLIGASTSGMATENDSPGAVFRKMAYGSIDPTKGAVRNAQVTKDFQKYLVDTETQNQEIRKKNYANRLAPQQAEIKAKNFKDFQLGQLPANVSAAPKSLLGG